MTDFTFKYKSIQLPGQTIRTPDLREAGLQNFAT